MAKSSAIVGTNLGLYLDRSKVTIPQQALSAGMNFRVKNGAYSNFNLGWERFESGITLNGPVLLIDSFVPLSQGLPEKLILGTATDIYEYRSGSHDVLYLTPRYSTGTVTLNGTTTVTGAGTSWANATLNLKPGDEIHFGSNSQRSPSALWFTIVNVVDNTHLTVNTAVGPFGPGGSYTIRRKFSGGAGTIYSTDVFVRDAGGIDTWYITNGIDPIASWNGTDTMLKSEFDGLVFPWRAKQLLVYSNMMIYMNLTQAGARKPADMANSIPGDPTTVAGGLASQFKVHSGSDEILTAKQIGDTLAIYSKRHIVLAQFVGDPLIFIFRTVDSTVGPVASRVVANFGDYHQFLGPDSQYQFDGVRVTESNRHVFREVLRTQDPTRTKAAYHHFDEESGELLWSVPSTTDTNPGVEGAAPSKAYVEAYLEAMPDKVPQPHSLREFPFTAVGYYTKQAGLTWDELTLTWQEYNFRWNDQFFSQAFPINLAGSFDGKLYIFNGAQNADGAALTSFIRFPKRPTMDGKCRGLVKRVYPFVTQLSTPLDVTVHMSDHAQGNATITDTQSFNQLLVEGGHFTDHYRRGRYVEVEFGTDGPSEPWELSGYDLDAVPGGCR